MAEKLALARCVFSCLLKHLMVRRFLWRAEESSRLIIPRPRDWFYNGLCGVEVKYSFSERYPPSRGPDEERASVLGGLPSGYFKQHYSFVLF